MGREKDMEGEYSFCVFSHGKRRDGLAASSFYIALISESCVVFQVNYTLHSPVLEVFRD